MPIKPLTASSLSALMTRIDNARHGELRSIIPHSPTSISIRFSVQDSARGFDWIDVVFRIDGVSDAKLIEDKLIKVLDMAEGITIEIEPKRAGLGIGRYEGRIYESSLYILGDSIMYEETGVTD